MTATTVSRTAAGAVAAMASLVCPSPCAAQGSVEFTPFVGVYLPTAPIIDKTHTGCLVTPAPFPVCPGFDSSIARQKATISLGGRIAYWPSDRFAAELAFAYAPSTATNGGEVASAHIVTAGARLLIGLLPQRRGTSVYLVGGGSLVAHGGDAYRAFSGTTKWGPVIGIGARVNVAPLLALRPELEDHVYSARFGDASAPARIENDLVLSLGLSAMVSGHSKAAR